MPTTKLPNYLRAERKRRGLSQEEIAYLLGCESGAKVSRYERFRREPKLETALAYEALFATPVRDLFAGLAQDAEREAKKRARRLLRRLTARTRHPAVERKLATLRALTEYVPVEEVRYEPLRPQ